MFPMRLMSRKPPSILVVPIGTVAGADLVPIAPALEGTLGCAVEVYDGPPIMPGSASGAAHAQCDASRLLRALLARFPDQRGKVVGVTSIDLFVPGLAWIYGQAQVEGPGAIVSLHRLAEAFYGRGSDSVLERRRLLTEVIHEAGHAFGLSHCEDPFCLMHWSGRVEQIDAKGEQFCGTCTERLRFLRKRFGVTAVAARRRPRAPAAALLENATALGDFEMLRRGSGALKPEAEARTVKPEARSRTRRVESCESSRLPGRP
jgi:archaemetzincin